MRHRSATPRLPARLALLVGLALFVGLGLGGCGDGGSDSRSSAASSSIPPAVCRTSAGGRLCLRKQGRGAFKLEVSGLKPGSQVAMEQIDTPNASSAPEPDEDDLMTVADDGTLESSPGILVPPGSSATRFRITGTSRSGDRVVVTFIVTPEQAAVAD